MLCSVVAVVSFSSKVLPEELPTRKRYIRLRSGKSTVDHLHTEKCTPVSMLIWGRVQLHTVELATEYRAISLKSNEKRN